MTSVTVTLPVDISNQWLDRVDGTVCTNGSRMLKTGRYEAVLTFENRRQHVTATEAATFVRNFLDEGFDDQIRIY